MISQKVVGGDKIEAVECCIQQRGSLNFPRRQTANLTVTRNDRRCKSTVLFEISHRDFVKSASTQHLFCIKARTLREPRKKEEACLQHYIIPCRTCLESKWKCSEVLIVQLHFSKWFSQLSQDITSSLLTHPLLIFNFK